MDDREFKELLQEDMEIQAEELMKLVNSDPSMQDVEVPSTLREKVFSEIREINAENARNQLHEKDKELVQLGKKYKKSKRLNLYVIVAAAIICALSVSFSAMGGPEKVFEKFKKSVSDREISYVNTDDERTAEIDTIDEIEAYEKIEKEYGVYPVSFDYLPGTMQFVELIELKEIQNVQLNYEDMEKNIITYRIIFDYRVSSVGNDVEDGVKEEYSKSVNGVLIKVKQYAIGTDVAQRWKVEFEYMDVQYCLMIEGINENEVNRIVENLYFPQS